MATVVVLMIVVVLLATSGYWWHQAQGDQQSLEGFHTLIDRLQRIDRQRPPDAPGGGRGSPEDSATSHIRIVPPAPAAPTVPPKATGAGAAAEGADWGPPVRVVPHPQPERAPVPASRPDGTARSSSAQSARGVLFFDDLASAAPRSEPAATPKIIPVREGDRPWLATAHRYAFPGTAALVAVIALIAVMAAATSGGGGGQPLSSNRAHPAASPSTTTVPVATVPSSASATSVAPSSTAAPPAPPSGGPQLTQVSPASGSPGQQVTIAGAGFLSSDGLIVVRFGAAQATVDCPNQTTCQAIVPASPPGSPPAGPQMITVSTGAGTSNPLTFNYT